MENNNFFFPKDSFSELVLELAKEKHLKHLKELKEAKTNLILDEIFEDRHDGYLIDTVNDIDKRISDIEKMNMEEFVDYLFYYIKSNHLEKINYEVLFDMLEIILPKPKFFVDRGYERQTA
ncbi:hypothetical protein [Lysinibacillus agricola]|uniref:hypothetical protein n=1 Tax=Lysinibacillus agricola TaxID=2590012 RepID=UPI003C288D1D